MIDRSNVLQRLIEPMPAAAADVGCCWKH